MRHVGLSFFSARRTLTSTYLTGSALLAAILSQPIQAEEKSYDCRALQNDQQRLECYDALFGKPEAQTSVMQEDENRITSQSVASTESPVIPMGEDALLRERFDREDRLFDYPFAIIPHKPSYLLPFTYIKDPNQQPFSDFGELAEDQSLDNAEVKFQLSLKVPLFKDFIFKNSSLWAAYTQLSLWQMYNTDASSPFRETNYEPEIFWKFDTDGEWMGTPMQNVSLGFSHQSNGRGAVLSRSWNRIYADFVWADDRWAFGFKPWYRIPEKEEDDDNPDIASYLGYADYTIAYKGGDTTITARLRNNLRSTDNRTSANVTVSFPLPGRLDGYVEYVNGYGETLLDYNHRNQRIGIGVVLNDWY